ncbi:MAG TPA: hypothetical protein VG841_02390 [Caulobacterales bacterium]|nr:hypothetical protein [Caulobacterales bacterium]
MSQIVQRFIPRVPKANLQDKVESALAAIPPDASADDIAEELASLGGIYALAGSPALGFSAFLQGGGMFAPRWGEAAGKGTGKARRFIAEQAGALIGVRTADAAVVVDPTTREVFKDKQVIRARA